MAKNFDYILLVADTIPSFKNLHNYCRLAEEQQPIYPDSSANNARKAFINHDYDFSRDIYYVKKIGNAASHDGGEPVNRVKAFRCLLALYNVVAGFLGRWGAVENIPPFDATLLLSSSTPVSLVTSPEPKVEMEVVDSVKKE